MKASEVARAARRVGPILAVLCSAAGCGGEDLTSVAASREVMSMARPQPQPSAEPDESEASAGEEIESAHALTTRASDGSYTSEIDATDPELWVYFSLGTGTEVASDTAGPSTPWHLGFQRSNVKLNGGESGTGEVSVAGVSQPFEAVVALPESDYLQDAPDSDMDGTPEYALSAGDGWYSYDPATHLLTARDTVFVLRTPEGFFKLQFLSYYDAAGTPGMPSFRWAPLGGS